MTNVLLVELPDSLPSCLGSWEDLYSYANRLSRRRGAGDVFCVLRWKPGAPRPLAADVVMVPARILQGPNGTEVPASPPELLDLLARLRGKALIGGVCAGVFVLAEAGLLDGLRATTHWSLAEEFRRRFPQVKLDPDALVIEEPGLLIGGGMTAYFDVGLRLILRFGGPELARDCASVFVLDPGRRFQSPFSPVGLEATETDPVLAQALDWALSRATLEFRVQEWATGVAVEKRTLERHALALWGFGPAERLRRLRLDRARLLVTSSTLPWDEVSRRCGYQDAAAFRRLFLQKFGQTPGEYRRRFG